MPIMLRMQNRPKLSELTETEQRYLEAHFNANQTELQIDGEFIELHRIDSVEVAAAARSGASGWLVGRVLFGGQARYHVGIFSGRHEAVLPNVTYNVARYVVQTIAYFLRTRIQYTGPEGLVPLDET